MTIQLYHAIIIEPSNETAKRICRYGGIGRRVWFRSIWGQPREGSSPFARTIRTERLRQGAFFISRFPLKAGPLKAGALSKTLLTGQIAHNAIPQFPRRRQPSAMSRQSSIAAASCTPQNRGGQPQPQGSRPPLPYTCRPPSWQERGARKGSPPAAPVYVPTCAQGSPSPFAPIER